MQRVECQLVDRWTSSPMLTCRWPACVQTKFESRYKDKWEHLLGEESDTNNVTRPGIASSPNQKLNQDNITYKLGIHEKCKYIPFFSKIFITIEQMDENGFTYNQHAWSKRLNQMVADLSFKSEIYR